ncbi:unnamed protein product [Acanthosepion pharaonis]|uniref:Uncharacterized protein n=1 Tax=Acanthosepion pharaonis TaxID=158019 RepID=A0A812B4U3_ACAPH|nr:unnamed protein product [Sepia pharaonis]
MLLSLLISSFALSICPFVIYLSIYLCIYLSIYIYIYLFLNMLLLHYFFAPLLLPIYQGASFSFLSSYSDLFFLYSITFSLLLFRLVVLFTSFSFAVIFHVPCLPIDHTFFIALRFLFAFHISICSALLYRHYNFLIHILPIKFFSFNFFFVSNFPGTSLFSTSLSLCTTTFFLLLLHLTINLSSSIFYNRSFLAIFSSLFDFLSVIYSSLSHFSISLHSSFILSSRVISFIYHKYFFHTAHPRFCSSIFPPIFSFIISLPSFLLF